MGHFTLEDGALLWQENQHKVWVKACGQDGLRIQASVSGRLVDVPQALVEAESEQSGRITLDSSCATITNGRLRAHMRSSGHISYYDDITGQLLLQEPDLSYFAPPNRHFQHREGGLYHLEAWFAAQPDERFWGLGQHQHGRFNNKGCVIDLQQRNTEVTIPFMVSNRGYGFLWNNPGVGRVELGENATRWVAYGTRQLDYVVVAGATPADILERYAELTGFTPLMPEWAAGFWQCKLRYETQEELLAVAREYHRRGLPLSVIVADFFHWSHMGDWRFDASRWLDPSGMVQELARIGVKLMVSIWPTVVPISENYEMMKENGLLVNNERGTDAQHVFIDHDINGPAYFAYYDATNPEARQFIWARARSGYYQHGIKLFWLDNDEPDINPWSPQNLRFYLGNGLEVASVYPLLHQKAFYDGLVSEGEIEVVTLSRSAWAGSQRFSSIVWSGDVASTFEALQAQLRAGLNMAMSGIPWWTTDIGGFHGGDTTTDYFRELIVRWFQFGVFCPIFRLHGDRLPRRHPFPDSGGDNEVWSFGEEVYGRLRELLSLRERLRPYIIEQMTLTSQTGLPVMRPLVVDFPTDPISQEVEDQFMFGPELMVAPVMEMGVRQRMVYVPAGGNWQNVWTGDMLHGGQRVMVEAPIDRIPVFVREGCRMRSLFTQ